jgi:hypothetical protein
MLDQLAQVVAFYLARCAVAAGHGILISGGPVGRGDAHIFYSNRSSIGESGGQSQQDLERRRG